MKKMYGINTPLVTPFDEKGKIDLPAMQEHIDYLISAGIHNLYPLGTMGEAALISVEERKVVAEKVLDYVAGRVGVFIHVGALSQTDTIELACHAKDIGADGIGVISPYFFHLDQQEIYDYYVAVSNSVPDDFPIYMYNLPGMTGNDILPETILSLSKFKNIVGIKNTMANDARLGELTQNCPEDFTIISGDDLIAFSGLALGASGLVSGTSNAFPELFVSMYDCVRKNDLSGAVFRQKQLYQILKLLNNDLKPCYVKEILNMRGFKKTYARAPLMNCCTDADHHRIHEGLLTIFKDTDFPFMIS